MDFQEIGWNGIRFKVPANWEISRIGLRYLYLENASGPALEIKWGPVRGRFSHKNQLRRLAALQRRPPGKAFQKCPLPTVWKDAVAAFDAECFTWKGRPLGGIGLVLYCPECHTATLIQFFRKNGAGTDGRFRKILASFRDHHSTMQVKWAIYDIKAVTPPVLQLTKYRFDAGAFELAFNAGGKKVTLYRWGPAAVLLRDRPLAAFAATVFRLPPLDPSSITISGSDGLQWISSPPENHLIRLVSRIRPAYTFKRHRIWHVAGKNRILGIAMEGKEPLETGLMDDLSAGYENI